MTEAGGQVSAGDDAELERYFQSLEREGLYRIDEVLKESPVEVTQRVSLVGADGRAQLGWQFVRKFIKRESGMGIAYERIFEAQREGRRFKHIPSVRECYANDDDQVVVMELVAGETLKEAVERVGPSEGLAIDAFPRLCDAVSELHEEFDPPLIHRDLTPANIVLSKGGLTLIDFGIAREYREGAFSDTTRFGTRSFAPPEQYGFGQTTVRSDVFALGMVLYYCLTGIVPDTYVDEADFEEGKVPPAYRGVIVRATALDPANRFSGAREMKAAFLAAGVRGASAASGVGRTDANAVGDGASGAGAPGVAVAVEAGGGAANVPMGASAGIGGAAMGEGAATSGNAVTRAVAAIGGANDAAFASAANAGSKGAANGGIGGSFVMGIAWDVLLALVTAVFLAACVAAFLEPPDDLAGYPVWASAVDFLVLLPATVIAAAWALADKRLLVQRFPRLGRYRLWHWLLLFVIVFCVMFIGIGAIGVLVG